MLGLKMEKMEIPHLDSTEKHVLHCLRIQFIFHAREVWSGRVACT